MTTGYVVSEARPAKTGGEGSWIRVVWRDKMPDPVKVGLVAFDPLLPYGETFAATVWNPRPKTRFFKTEKGAVSWVVKMDLG